MWSLGRSRISAIARLSNTIIHRYASSSQQQSLLKKQQPEVVSVLRLNMLQDNPGAIKKKRRVGRGIGSSKGKTSGRGHKGQKARSGTSIPPDFTGGQTKFYKTLPKRGFSNKRHGTPMVGLNVGTIQDYIDMGRLPSTLSPNNNILERPYTIHDFIQAGIFPKSSIKHGVKLLAKGKERLRDAIAVDISRASQGAIEAIESVGGAVTTVHYNALALRVLIRPEKFESRRVPKRARPPPKLQPYYTNWKRNRGYLSVQAQMRSFLLQAPQYETIFQEELQKRLDVLEKEEKEKNDDKTNNL